MTLKEHIDYLSRELKENPDWADREIEFCTIDRDNLLFLSVYDREDKVCFDIGTAEDDEENISMMLERGMR
jgi:hypothetical protein